MGNMLNACGARERSFADLSGEFHDRRIGGEAVARHRAEFAAGRGWGCRERWSIVVLRAPATGDFGLYFKPLRYAVTARICSLVRVFATGFMICDVSSAPSGPWPRSLSI